VQVGFIAVDIRLASEDRVSHERERGPSTAQQAGAMSQCCAVYSQADPEG